MPRRLRWLLPVTLLVCLAAAPAVLPAQLKLQPVPTTGDSALALQLRKLRMAGTLMMTDAHPDDENNALLAWASHGLGLRTTLVTATRGDGGQNEIGPEISDALAVLRTEELLAAHRFDGAEQYFTRAIDFGYSFSIDETYEKWGRDAIIGDFVRHIRTIRPDVIVGFLWTGTNGGLHHQASTHLTAEAFRAAADPSRYPDQIKEGLHPWQAAKFYYTGGGGFGGRGGRGAGPTESSAPVPTGTYDPVLGETYNDLGVEARTMHRCQDVSQLLALPGPGRGRGYHLQDCTIPGELDKAETSIFDGVDLTLTGLARFAGATPPAALTIALRTIVQDVDQADAAFKRDGANAAVAPLAAGLHQVRALRSSLGRLGLSADAVYEIDFRLARTERNFQDALLTAASVRVDAVASDMTVTPGQVVPVTLYVGNRGTAAVELTGLTAHGTADRPCRAQSLAPGAAVQCAEALTIPADARLSDITFKHDPKFERYIFDPTVPFGVPFAPTAFRATFGFTIAGEPVETSLPVQARNGTDMIAGEKRSDLLVVPALTLTLTPDVIVAPTGAPSTREIRVTVRNNSREATTANVQLHVPARWSVTPTTTPVTLSREDEETTVRFAVSAPAGLPAGPAAIDAVATVGSTSYVQGYQVVEYPHIHRRLLFHPAEAKVQQMDVKVAPNLRVGYIMGSGDRIPDAIEQLGVPVTLLTPDDLAWGDLSKYPVIMTGVRAYGNRPDLRANNQRLLDYVHDGGVLLVNYNRTEFNDAQYGPYPAKTSSNRVTDENAPVRILVPDHPVFTTPNVIGPSTWDGWVQERGTYFLGDRAKEYVDLLESEDPFPNNAGPKRGALVEAHYGRGRWVYIGLVLWRQLPAGVPGAYQLLANLISLGSPAETPAAAAPPSTRR
ncbi:MAG TPA: PIG-L family deacetylase [Vicinamibacterales bacterium]|nr:PIG-L family deacetylase [Vicinamibacterales bacterium]